MHDSDAVHDGPLAVLDASGRAGSCNFCTRYITPAGITPHPVLVITRRRGGGMQVRLCGPCAKALRPDLAALVATPVATR